MSRLDSSACVSTHETRVLKTCVAFLYFCDECRQQRAALHFWQMKRQQSSMAYFFTLIGLLVKRGRLSRET